MGLRVWGFRFQVSGFGFRVYPIHIQRAGQSRQRPPTPNVLGLETRGLGFGCGDSAFRFSDIPSLYSACRTDGIECGDSGFRFRASDSPSPYPLCRTDAPKPPTPPMLLSCPNVRSLRDPPLLRGKGFILLDHTLSGVFSEIKQELSESVVFEDSNALELPECQIASRTAAVVGGKSKI